MSTAQTLGLGAVAGFTIFLGLPIGRMQNVSAQTKAFLSSTATGILVFLLWDILSGAVAPVESALKAGRDGRFVWLAFILAAGFSVGLLRLVYYDGWLKPRRPGLGERARVDPVPRARGGLDPLRRRGAAERRPAARIQDARDLGRAVRPLPRVRDRLHPHRRGRLVRPAEPRGSAGWFRTRRARMSAVARARREMK